MRPYPLPTIHRRSAVPMLESWAVVWALGLAQPTHTPKSSPWRAWLRRRFSR